MTPIPPPLLEIVAANGVSIHFTVLDQHQCAIVRDGVIVETLGSDGGKMQVALNRYFLRAREEGGARQRLQSIRLPDDPRRKPARDGGPTLVASIDRRNTARVGASDSRSF
jgi:hypothetical protein